MAGKKKKKAKKLKKPKGMYKKPWFKRISWPRLALIVAIYCVLVALNQSNQQATELDLVELDVTVSTRWIKNGSRVNYRWQFMTKEYSNRFVIDKAVSGALEEQLQATVKRNHGITVKIEMQSRSLLEDPEAVVPIYYLESSSKAVLFDEARFDRLVHGMEKRYFLFFTVVCLAGIIVVLTW